MHIEIFDEPFSDESNRSYHQNIMRLVSDDGLKFQIALKIPQRVFGDRKSVSAKQRSTIDGFFFDHDITPKECGWQQASSLINMRALAYAVAETLDDGFLAANRIMVAPFIAAYISQQPYLCAVARGWSLATWDKTPVQNATSRIDQKNAWLALITSPFYRELFTFANNVKQDIHNAAVEQGLIFEDLDIAEQ